MARNTPTPGQKIAYFLVILFGVFILYLDINTQTFNSVKNGFSSRKFHRHIFKKIFY